MDVALISYIRALSEVTQIEVLDIKEHLLVRRTNAVPGTTVTIAVSQSEPHDIVLPDNVLWACFDKSSFMYKKMYRRTSRDADAGNNTVHTWKQVNELADIWQEQVYAPGEEPSNGAVLATTTARGILTLATDPQDAEHPVVVSVEDPRNTDARTPLPHDEMHPNLPAEQLVTDNADLTITAGTPVLGSVLMGSSTGPTTHTKMDLAHICEDLVPGAVQDPNTISEAPYSGKIDFGGTIVNKFNGYAENITLTISVAVYGTSLTSKGLRKFLGYFTPSSLKVNGQVISGNTVTIALGDNTIEATVTAPGYPSLVLTETLQGV